MEYNKITLHCSATQNEPSISVEQIDQMHKNRGWNEIGYHFVITTDGKVHKGRSLSKIGAHVYKHNKNNIGICLIGGVDKGGVPEMNFTPVQQASALNLVLSLQLVFDVPTDNVKGHRDYSPDLDGDGKIEKHEWIKQCPCFDVAKFMKTGVMNFE